MILEELTLHNFGVYRDRQVCSLATTKSKPIVLIGGLNGAGKSTFMDAIQLALYGKRARCSNRGRLSYEEYLKRSIHERGRPSDGAGIELQFRYRSQGEDHTYRVSRYWTSNGSVKERLAVLHDGVHSRVATDSWAEHIEAIIPINLSELFFFDGEKIEALADLERSTDFLRTAMHSLLGLHLVTSLNADLTLVERRKRREAMPPQQRDVVDDLITEIERLTAQRAALSDQRATAKNECESRQKELRRVLKGFELEGGQLLEQRTQLENRRDRAVAELAGLENSLRDLAAGPAPLLLVQRLLDAVRRQDGDEQKVEGASSLLRVLEDRDARVIAKAKRSGASTSLLEALRTFLDRDRRARRSESRTSPYLSLSAEASTALGSLISVGLPDAKRAVRTTLDRVAAGKKRLDEADQALARVPEKDAGVELLRMRNAASKAVDRASTQLATIDGQLHELGRHITILEKKRTREERRAAEGHLESQDAGRVIEFATKARGALDEFRSRVVSSHIARIEQLILESFQSLLRKKTLITALHIDTESFELVLTGSHGLPLPADRLSAGERQLLAVAILWGLRTASDRPLPVVIDTPLGRLDSSHRSHVVSRYFPRASQQVILLSTDEEINRSYHHQLVRRVAHSHMLDFSESDQSTTIRPGYFW